MKQLCAGHSRKEKGEGNSDHANAVDEVKPRSIQDAISDCLVGVKLQLVWYGGSISYVSIVITTIYHIHHDADPASLHILTRVGFLP